jgi:hypothetical protein
MGTAAAKPVSECMDTRYHAVMPALKKLKFGIDRRAARSALQKAYPDKGRIIETPQSVRINFHRHEQDIFDQVAIGFIGDVAVYFAFSYSDGFQAKMGGGGPAVETILAKVMEKVGRFTDHSSYGDSVKLIWPESKGLAFKLVGRDPNVLVFRFECAPAVKQAQKAMSGSLGF